MPDRRYPGQGTLEWDAQRRAYRAGVVVGRTEAGNARRVKRWFYVRKGSKNPAHYSSEGRAKAAAERWLAEQHTLLEQGRLSTSRAVTVAQAAEAWLAAKRSAKRAASTLATYEDYSRRWIVPYLGSRKLAHLSREGLRDWLARIADEGASEYVVAESYRYFKLILNFAEDEGWGFFKPLKKLEVYRPPRAERTRWTPLEARIALAWASHHDPWLYRYMHLVLACDLRREEVLGLKWARINLEPANTLPYLDVVEVATVVRGRWHFNPLPKNKKPRRVYFHADTAHVLEEQHQAAQERRRKAKVWNDHDLVFPNARGRPWSESELRKSWAAMLLATGVTPMVPYDLRSTAISIRDSRTSLPEYVLAARAGHSPAVRKEHYQRSVREQQQAAALTLNGMLRE